MAKDYFTKTYRSEQKLVDIAREWRLAGGIENHEYFDIVNFIETTLTQKYTVKGRIQVKFLERNQDLSFDDDPPAFVTYSPLILHVDKEIWDEAKIGEPNARFILAHEIGHIFLHDNYVQSFSANPDLQLRFPQKEYKTEWQANTFGTHFLIGAELLHEYSDASEISINFLAPKEAAKDAIEFYKKTNRRPSPIGDFCVKCGGYQIFNKENSQRCLICFSRMSNKLINI